MITIRLHLHLPLKHLKQLGFEIIEPPSEPQVIEGEAVEVGQNLDDPSLKAVEAPKLKVWNPM